MAALATAGLGGRFRRALQRELDRAVAPSKPVLVSSARYGIALAIRLLGLEGGRVAVPGYVCPAVLTSLAAANAKPVPIDCLPGSIRFDPEALLRAIQDEGADAVLAANTYGLDQDFALLGRLGVPVIDDSAYQAGFYEPGGSRLCGTRGDAGVWSFNFKALDGIGGGVLLVRKQDGACAREIVTDERTPFRDAMRFINYAARSAGRHRIPKWLPGTAAPTCEPEIAVRRALLEMREAPISELQACVALVQWQSRHALVERQRRNASILKNVIENCDAFTSLSTREEESPVHFFPVLIRVAPANSRAAVHRARLHLYSNGVQTESPYPLPLGSPGTLPNSNDLSERMFLVPCNASLESEQMDRISSALKEASRVVAREFNVASEAELIR